MEVKIPLAGGQAILWKSREKSRVRGTRKEIRECEAPLVASLPARALSHGSLPSPLKMEWLLALPLDLLFLKTIH